MRHPALLLLLALLAPRALACPCNGGWLTEQQKIDAADVVFAGRVLSIDPPAEGRFDQPRTAEERAQRLAAWERWHAEGWGPYWGRKVTFAVEKVWKGTQSQLIEVWTGNGGGDWGIPFAVDRSYLVFGRIARSGFLNTCECDGTIPLACGRAQLTALGEPADYPLPEEKEPIDPRLVPCVKGPRRTSGRNLIEAVPRAIYGVRYVVDREGHVRDVAPKDFGDPEMLRLAELLREWCFAPATLNGKPVAVFFDSIFVPEVRE